MKAVMLSIQPKWCELIASGKKTVEVRKTKPKIDVPFKCYIYMTKTYDTLFGYGKPKKLNVGGGCVIGEFVCDRIDTVASIRAHCMDYITVNDKWDTHFCEISCLNVDELAKYLGFNKDGYGWHISNLVIYDKPKELSEFYVEGDCDCMNCRNCAWFDRGNGYNVEDDCHLAYKGVDEHKSYKPIKRPFQSWGYVEELKGETE